MLDSVANDFSATGVHLPGVNLLEGNTSLLEVALIFRRRLTTSVSGANDDRAEMFANTGIRLVRLDFESKDRFRFETVDKTLYIFSGMPFQYDGHAITEQGFSQFPENVTATGNVLGGGGLTATSTYNYRVYYEWINALGERQRSTTFRPVTVVLGGADDSVEITYYHGVLTKKIPGNSIPKVPSASVVFYRTEANADVVGGAPFYRVSNPNPEQTGFVITENYYEPFVSSGIAIWTDALSDADLINNELDYQNTGELDNVQFPTGHITTYGKDRLFLAGMENPNEIVHSKLRFPGEQLEFNDALKIQVPDIGGPITALDILNQFLVVFKKDRIYVISGDGPDNFGQGSFSQAELVTTDVGCINQSSIVRTPGGLMFSSDKGIFLLSGNLQTTYVGADVEAYNGQNITAATLLNDANQVRFLTDAGRTLVFDYQFGQWSTFTNHKGLSAVVWGEDYVYLRTTGKDVFLEQENLFTDDGSHYSLRVKTAWLVLGTTQNYQRARRLLLLGNFFSEHELLCLVRYNFESFSTPITWDPSGVITATAYGDGIYGEGAYGGSGSSVYQVRFALPRQKCESVQFEFYDRIINTPAGQAYQISALTLEAGIKKGPVKLGTGRTTGS
jgi:hypothetical protein